MRIPPLLHLVTLVLPLLQGTPAATAAPSIWQAVDPGGFKHATLSPDGKHIAMIGYSGLNHGLYLTEVDSKNTKLLIAGRRVEEGFWTFNKEPLNVIWITNDLLLVDYGPQLESITLSGKKVAEIGWAVKSGVAILGKAEPDKPDSTTFLMISDASNNEISLADAKTGKSTKFKQPTSGKMIAWAFDRHGQLRAATMLNSSFWQDASSISNWYKASAGAEWEKLAEYKVGDNFWTPLHVPDEPDSLIISDNGNRDTQGIFRYHTRQRATVELLAGHPTQDIISARGLDKASFTSVVTNGMIPQHYWFDADWQKVQKSVDQALPKRVNILSGDPKNRVLIHSTADVDPGTWYLMDVANSSISEIAQVRHAINPEQMLPMQAINYPASDGLSIPAWLTRPAGQASTPRPTVVLVHGGPIARDYWYWDPDVQLLAGRGYVVFQPQFRGSSGFGEKFMRAGFGQWGLAMQDDITAGVEYLIKQGIADPKRICIYGASYGGYAALWGLVKTPNLYQCGISFAGVVDIEYMFRDSSDVNSERLGREWRRVIIGDLQQDKDKFDKVSPLKHADKITAPVLLIHGDNDQRVPIAHAKKMKRALEQHNRPPEWLVFENEGHGIRYIKNRKTYFETVLKFLDKHIGPAKDKATPTTQVTEATGPAAAGN